MELSIPLLFLGLMVVGTFFLGYNDVQRKKYLNKGLNEQALLVITQILVGILLFPLILVFGMPEIRSEFWSAFAGTVALNVVSQNLFIRAFKLSNASLIAPLRLIIPPLVIVTGFLFLRELPTWQGGVGIVVTVVGLWFLLFPSFKPTFKLERGVVYGLIGSVMWAVSFPLDKQAVVSSSGLFATAAIAVTVGIITFIINQIRNPDFLKQMNETLRTEPKGLLSIAGSYALGLVLTNQALNYGLAAYASSLKRLQAVWTVVLSGKILKEEGVTQRLLATIVMFAGILFTVFFQ